MLRGSIGVAVAYRRNGALAASKTGIALPGIAAQENGVK
jgi:hypothetical protein